MQKSLGCTELHILNLFLVNVELFHVHVFIYLLGSLVISRMRYSQLVDIQQNKLHLTHSCIVLLKHCVWIRATIFPWGWGRYWISILICGSFLIVAMTSLLENCFLDHTQMATYFASEFPDTTWNSLISSWL